MKKAAKKLFAVLLALAMLSTLAVPVFAADPPAADLSGHTFDVYQIFKGTVAAKAGDNGLRLSNAEWGDGIVQSLFVPDIAAYTLFEKNPFTSFTTTTTAAEVVAVMENWAENDSQNALNFARRAYFCINKGTANRHSSQNGTSITFNEDGYYLIVDATSTHNKDQARNFSNLILAKAGTSIEVTPKVVKPTVTKQVQTNTNLAAPEYGTSASHAINEPFYFKLTATLPASTAYKYYRKYEVRFNDNCSNGITLDDLDTNLTVQIKCGAKTATLTAGTDYTLTHTTTPAGFTLFIQLINEFQFKSTTSSITVDDLQTNGAEIEVTYKAHLNESADVITYPAAGTTANVTNKNSVTLHYSNSPNNEDPLDTVHGTTTAAAAYVATFGVNNTKYADNLPADGGAALAGAEFKLYNNPTCDATNEVKLYKSGDYYYPVGTSGKQAVEYMESAANGKFDIGGLDAGTYYLQETKAPDGYNTCGLIEIKINATLSNDTVDLTNAKSMVNNIVDQSGVVLPSTGGIGTTIFYVVGGLLMVGAAVLLVTKKRMQKN